MASSRQIIAVDTIEHLIQEDVGRNMFRAFDKTKGELWNAACSIAYGTLDSLHVGLVTGFFIEKPNTVAAAAETDGPLGTAQMAFALSKLGVKCRVITDVFCAPIVKAALDASGASRVALDIVQNDPKSLEDHITNWKADAFSHVIATERPGISVNDNKPHNMNGGVIDKCVPFDRIFKNGDKKWVTIGIGDGGNEIGMGKLPVSLICDDIANGDKIASRTGADHLITAGVSNWGMVGLMGAVAIHKPEWRHAMQEALSPMREMRIVEAMIKAGSVDGITKDNTMTIDRLPMTIHLEKSAAIVQVLNNPDYRPEDRRERLRPGSVSIATVPLPAATPT